MLPVALDAMGGDHAPGAVVEGALIARNAGVPVLLVGRPDDVGDTDGIPVHPASEVIAMGEDPGAGVRRKKDSSLVRCAELVRDGQASAMVSAGNTGATMASALLRMGRIRGVSRPAIATVLPKPGHRHPTVLLDSGANAECQAAWLLQFAQMGAEFARHRLGLDDPRVGLLSIGEEAGKGNDLVKEAHDLLEAAPGLHFVGNVEGRDVLTEVVDVVVADGFTGNVVLKTLEGALQAVAGAVRDGMVATEAWGLNQHELQAAYDAVYASLDPESFGGAMLLGVDGVCIISHGSSSSRAVANAVRMAADMVEADVVGGLRAAIGR